MDILFRLPHRARHRPSSAARLKKLTVRIPVLLGHIVGILLLRNTTDADYGLYVMAFSTLILAQGIQGALVEGPMMVIGAKKSEEQRRTLAGGLFGLIGWAITPLGLLAMLGFAAAGWTQRLPAEIVMVGLAASLSVVALLFRDFLRHVFLLNSRPDFLLRSDAIYVALVILSAAIAAYCFAPEAAPVAVLGLGGAAVLALLYSYRLIATHIGWRAGGGVAAFMETWRLGKWGAVGCVVTWIRQQGFYYLLAALLSIEAVAAVAAVRLLIMPVNLLVTGVGQQLLPVASRWLSELGERALVLRALVIGSVLLTGALVYFALLWVLREWVMGDLLNRDTTGMDELLLLWGAVFGIMTVRHASMIVVQALERFDFLVYVSFVSTPASLLVGYWGITQYGAGGALLGLIAAELIDLSSNSCLILRRLWQRRSIASA